MKKFLLGAVILALAFLGLRYVIYYKGFYIDLHPDVAVEISVKTEDKTLLLMDKEGNYQPFTVKGVDLPSNIAGHFSTDYAVDEETWMRWFGMIQEMGANTIRIPTIYNDVFYNSFYKYNKDRQEPLYLLQGIQVSGYANHSGKDAYGPEFYAVLKQDALDVVDVVHGRKNIVLNRMKGSGIYRKDVSSWVLGYVIGNEWNAGTVAYTDHSSKRSSVYEGTYFRTEPEATVFEAMLANIMDSMVSYETKKYKTQKLVSFQNDPMTDPFVYEEIYARQLGKYSFLDAEHIRATEELKSGYFASYRLYDFCTEFYEYFSEEQQTKLSGIWTGKKDAFYENYSGLLHAYHTIPVLITGYGFSTSRGIDSEGMKDMTEEQQGERLAEVYEIICQAGLSGACISTWQDVWGRRSWNSAYAVDVNNAAVWHDVQTEGQGYGILAFDPGKEESVCYVDGDPGEWTEEDRVLEEGGLSLSAKYDEAYFYLLLEADGLTSETKLYVPIDTTPKTGSMTCRKPSVSFERAADFLLCIDGEERTRLLVQKRYEVLRENWLLQITGENPFISYPEKESDKFVAISMVLKNRSMVTESATDEEFFLSMRLDTHETGKLMCGNGNPKSSDYNSLADFCYGKDCVEIRLPWQLLNFSNPSNMEIQDDFYENYGVEWFQIQELFLGAREGDSETPIAMYSFPLKGWGDTPVFHERKKRSYDIMKECWGKENEN